MNNQQKTIKPQVWMITGATRGLGRAILYAALEAGHNVVTISRSGNVTLNKPEYADRLLSLRLDITEQGETPYNAVVQAALERFGTIDVLVNNAGHGQFTFFEETVEEQIREVFETNLFGLMRMTRAVLPVMRRQRSGHIMNVSSAAGYSGIGPSIYHTSKFAVTGFSEALAFETEQFGIHVTIVAPGLFRTEFMNFNPTYHNPSRKIDDYNEFRSQLQGFVNHTRGNEPGNPATLGRLLVEVAAAERPPLHLPVGADAIDTLETHHRVQTEEVKVWHDKSCATAFPPEGTDTIAKEFFK